MSYIIPFQILSTTLPVCNLLPEDQAHFSKSYFGPPSGPSHFLTDVFLLRWTIEDPKAVAVAVAVAGPSDCSLALKAPEELRATPPFLHSSFFLSTATDRRVQGTVMHRGLGIRIKSDGDKVRWSA